MLQTGIVGCGGIAQVHAHALTRLDGVTAAAFADVKPERAADFAARFGGRAFASLEEMLAGCRLDAVHICTPHYLHFPMIKACLDKGLYVFSEKPPVMTEAELAGLCAISGRERVGFSFQNRWNGNFTAVRAILEKGELGAVTGVKGMLTWHRTAPYYTESGWRGSPLTEGGGVVINQAIHTLDLMVQLLGMPKAISATTANRHLQGIIEVEDTAEAYLDYGDKAALFYATTAYSTDSPVMIEITCEGGSLRMVGDALEIRTAEGLESHSFTCDDAVGKAYWGTGHGKCIFDFYRAINEGTVFPCNADSIVPTMKVMFGLYASAAAGGKRVELG